MGHVIANVHGEGTGYDSISNGLREDGMCQLSEGIRKRSKQDWGHDEPHTIHRKIVVDTV